MSPHEDMNLEIYADADFYGIWHVEQTENPVIVCSRTVYIMTLD